MAETVGVHVRQRSQFAEVAGLVISKIKYEVHSLNHPTSLPPMLTMA
jgi:hypothetical protein